MVITGNVFEDFYVVKMEVFSHTEMYKAAHIKLINELEGYFKSKQWSRNEVESMLWNLAGKSLSLEDKAEIIGKTYESVKTMSSRLNTRLKEILFDGKKLYDVCTSSDIEVVNNTLRNIKYQAYRGINIFSELNTNTLKIIDNADYRDSEHELSEKDLFDALAFLAMHSKEVIKYQAGNLNKEAISRVLELLSGDKYSEYIGYYMWFKNKYNKAFNTSDKTIQMAKESEHGGEI